MNDGWERVTFAGTERAQAAEVARLEPWERVALLEELLEIARQSGALARVRAERQAEADRLWRGEGPAAV